MNKVANLVEELEDILKYLPTEDPPGSEDIYGFDTSITWGSAEVEGANGGPQGVSGGTSNVQASKDQKAKSQRAIEIMKEIKDA